VLSVGVVGGGIGGLAAALSLHRAGFDVHVYEQAGSVSEIGAGIQVSPNATRVLHGLGLGDDLAAMGVRPLALHQRRWDDGQTLLRTPLEDAVVDAFGFAWYQTHRADLLTILLRGLPAERVHVGHRLVGVVERAGAVEAEFENGKSVLVDALDGIHSTVQGILFGPRTAHFTGCASYRGLIPAERLSDLELEVTCDVWMGPGRHFVHYFVRNKQLFNFAAAVEQDSWTGESWTDKVDVATALAEFEGWHPQVRAMITAVDEVSILALFDRPPLERWSVAPRYSAMPAIRCCRSWLKALRRQSRTARCSLPASPDLAARTSRSRSIATSSSGYPAPHVFKRRPLPTRGASTSRMVPNKSSAMHRWRPDQPTLRNRRSRGSSNTTQRGSSRRASIRPRGRLPVRLLVGHRGAGAVARR
jgi:salicylate hydroxylase